MGRDPQRDAADEGIGCAARPAESGALAAPGRAEEEIKCAADAGGTLALAVDMGGGREPSSGSDGAEGAGNGGGGGKSIIPSSVGWALAKAAATLAAASGGGS